VAKQVVVVSKGGPAPLWSIGKAGIQPYRVRTNYSSKFTYISTRG
jgi:hypothetical protein